MYWRWSAISRCLNRPNGGMGGSCFSGRKNMAKRIGLLSLILLFICLGLVGLRLIKLTPIILGSGSPLEPHGVTFLYCPPNYSAQMVYTNWPMEEPLSAVLTCSPLTSVTP